MHCVMVDSRSMLKTKIYFETGERLIGIEREILDMYFLEFFDNYIAEFCSQMILIITTNISENV